MMNLHQYYARQYDRRNITSAEVRGFGRVFIISRKITPVDWPETIQVHTIVRCEIFGHGLHARGFGIHADAAIALKKARENALANFCLSAGLLPPPESYAQSYSTFSQDRETNKLRAQFAFPAAKSSRHFVHSAGITSASCQTELFESGRQDFIKHNVLSLLPFDQTTASRFSYCKLEEAKTTADVAFFLLSKDYNFRLMSTQLPCGLVIAYASAFAAGLWPSYVFGSAIHSDDHTSKVSALKQLLMNYAIYLDGVHAGKHLADRAYTFPASTNQTTSRLDLDQWTSTPIDGCIRQHIIQVDHAQDAPIYLTRTLVPCSIDNSKLTVRFPIPVHDIPALFKMHRL